MHLSPGRFTAEHARAAAAQCSKFGSTTTPSGAERNVLSYSPGAREALLRRRPEPPRLPTCSSLRLRSPLARFPAPRRVLVSPLRLRGKHLAETPDRLNGGGRFRWA